MSEYYKLEEAVRRTEATSTAAQNCLHEILLKTIYHKKLVVGLFERNTEVYELVQSGLVLSVDHPEIALHTIQEKNHKLIYERLVGLGITDRKKSWDHVAYCIENPDLIEKVAFDACTVSLVPELEKVRRKLYTYLNRKLMNESYYDPDLDEFVDIPKGSYFTAILSIGGESSSHWEFPDDEITDLLDQYGCNRCRTWQTPKK